ncbi:MAG TPA: carboxypeptidase-like regulatory domain-containing protein, partial [Terriglobales bacterium]
VPNSNITATNTDTGVQYTTKSLAAGNYEFTRLPIGKYRITAEVPGFQKFNANGIALNIDQEYVQPIKLQVGNVSETVEVQADIAQVDTTNIQLSNIVNSAQIVDLPLIGRNFTQLEQLVPGVVAASDRFGTFAANGSQSQQTSFLINGTDTNDFPLNTIVFTPSPDAIQQFNLVTSSLNPEYSRNSGAIVSATIKNGTNNFHGDAFEFYRDTFLNNHNFFQKVAPKFHQNLYGGTLGGPILKDKMFFFLSYQGLRAVAPQTVGQNLVFTPADLTGNLSDLTFSSRNATHVIPGTINIPGPAQCAANGTNTWGPCLSALGNQIPTAAFNPLSLSLVQQFVPLPNTGTNAFQFNPTTQNTQDQGIARFDINASSSNQFWGVVGIQHAPSINALPFTGSTLPGFGAVNQSDVHQYIASWSHIFSSTTLNEFRAAYTRFNFDAVEPQTPTLPSDAGFAITPQNAASAGLPKITVNGFFTLGFSNNGPQPRIDQTYQLDDNFSKVLGRHSLKFGYDGRRFNVDNPFFAANNGSFSFSNSGQFSTGNAAADFLLGIPSTFAQGSGAVINAVSYEHYFYGQDQWKARDNFTVTLGLGWQIDTAIHNKQFNNIGVTCFIPGEQSGVFPTAPVGLVYPGDPGCNNSSGATTAWKDVGPRVGFAWAPNLGWLSGHDAHKLSIRGGYGIYYNRTEEETSLQNLEDPPFGLNTSGANDFVLANGGRIGPSFANPFQDINSGTVFPNKFPFVFPTAGQQIDFSGFEPVQVSQYSPHFRIPYSQNFNLTIQRELPSSIVATISYVGALGRHEQLTFEGNPITQAGHDACLADPSCVDDADFQARDFPDHTQFGNGNVIRSVGTIDTAGTSSYHSLQLSATKNFTHGLYFQASYTWSHSIDNASSFEDAGFGGVGGSGTSSRGFNQFVPALNVGDSVFDARHRFVFSPVYNVPNWGALPGMHWLPGIIGKGWEINGILTLQTGFPFDVSYAGGASFSLFCAAGDVFYACPDAPNQIAPLKKLDPRSGGPANAQFFDPSSFVDETTGSFGNIRRDAFHGPGLINTDVIIGKRIFFWPGREDRYMQLRLESYNVFNHTNFNQPDSNFLDNGATFGKITGAAPGRQTQLGLKIYF